MIHPLHINNSDDDDDILNQLRRGSEVYDFSSHLLSSVNNANDDDFLNDLQAPETPEPPALPLTRTEEFKLTPDAFQRTTLKKLPKTASSSGLTAKLQSNDSLKASNDASILEIGNIGTKPYLELQAILYELEIPMFLKVLIHGRRIVEVLISHIIDHCTMHDITLKGDSYKDYEFRLFDEDDDELDEDVPALDPSIDIMETRLDMVAMVFVRRKSVARRRATFVLEPKDGEAVTAYQALAPVVVEDPVFQIQMLWITVQGREYDPLHLSLRKEWDIENLSDRIQRNLRKKNKYDICYPWKLHQPLERSMLVGELAYDRLMAIPRELIQEEDPINYDEFAVVDLQTQEERVLGIDNHRILITSRTFDSIGCHVHPVLIYLFTPPPSRRSNALSVVKHRWVKLPDGVDVMITHMILFRASGPRNKLIEMKFQLQSGKTHLVQLQCESESVASEIVKKLQKVDEKKKLFQEVRKYSSTRHPNDYGGIDIRTL